MRQYYESILKSLKEDSNICKAFSCQYYREGCTRYKSTTSCPIGYFKHVIAMDGSLALVTQAPKNLEFLLAIGKSIDAIPTPTNSLFF